MKGSKTLPAGYRAHGTLDLSRHKLAAVGMNIGALALFVVAGRLLLLFVSWLRPGESSFEISFDGVGGLVGFLLAGFGLVLLMMVLHEAIHGLLFWRYTGERPVFGLKALYAYAAAPDWYLPRNQHIVVALAPLVLITFMGLLLMLLVPAAVLVPLLAIVVLNIGGAIGDLVVVVWLVLQPPATLVQDSGAAITLYRPGAQPVAQHDSTDPYIPHQCSETKR